MCSSPRISEILQDYPDISPKVIPIINSYITELFERTRTEAVRLAKYNKKAIITSREIKLAVRHLFKEETGTK